VTDEPLFLLRMDTDIALARLASGRTVPIGAECGCGVHDGPPGVVWKHAKRSIFGPPFSLQVSCTTVKCRATLPPLYPLNRSLAADIEPAAKDPHSPPPQAAGQPERFSCSY